MTNHLHVSALLMFVFCASCKGQHQTEPAKDDITSGSKDIVTPHRSSYDTKRYGQGIIIENSFPKGGPYTNPFTGKSFGHAIFWTRVINETTAPIELTINFPADSFAIPPTPDSYLKLFLPPDTMTFDKESKYAYGATGLKSFLDAGLHKRTTLRRTINPKEESLFYIGALSYESAGVVRAGLVLKDQELFYQISISPHFDSASFPCGHIVFKE